MSALRREARFDMKGVLRPRASVTWEAPLEVSRFERGTAQPVITLFKGEEDTHMLDGSIKEGTGNLVLPYTPIQIKFTDLLLLPPSHLLQTQNFRALWDRLGHAVVMDAVVDQPEGQLLSENLVYDRVRGPEHAVGFVSLPTIPTSHHMQAAGLSRTWNGNWLAYYCIGAYTVHPEEMRTPADATATATATATDPTTDPATATATVTPTPMEAEVKKVQGVWRVQYEFRSSSQQVIEALRSNSQMWLDDLTDEQVTLVNLYGNCNDDNYRKMESVEFVGLSNMQIESEMSMDDVLYKWNVMKRARKNRYMEVAEEGEEEGNVIAEDL